MQVVTIKINDFFKKNEKHTLWKELKLNGQKCSEKVEK